MALTTGKIEPSENSQTFTHLAGSEMVKTIEIHLPSTTIACVYNVKVVSSASEVLFNHTFYGNSKPINNSRSINKRLLEALQAIVDATDVDTMSEFDTRLYDKAISAIDLAHRYQSINKHKLK